MLALKVTPKKVIFLFFIFLLKISLILSSERFDLFYFAVITDFITDKVELNISRVVVIAVGSLGKHNPPSAGPDSKNLTPSIFYNPMTLDIT